MAITHVGPGTSESSKGLQRHKVVAGAKGALLPMFELVSKMGQLIPEQRLQGPFKVANSATPQHFTPTQVHAAVLNLKRIYDAPYADYTLLLNIKTAGLRWIEKSKVSTKETPEVDLLGMNPKNDSIRTLCRQAILIASASPAP